MSVEKPNDSTVCCRSCGRTVEVRFGSCLAKGWPKCCGYTMELISQPKPTTIDAAVADIMAPLSALRRLQGR